MSKKKKPKTRGRGRKSSSSRQGVSASPVDTSQFDEDGVLKLLRTAAADMSPAFRRIAHHIQEHTSDIPFETAESLAKKTNVSAVTVGRFSKFLGCKNFRDFKLQLKADKRIRPWLVGSDFDSFITSIGSADYLSDSLNAEMRALAEIYQLPHTDAWKKTAKVLASSQCVWVAGFQPQRGAAYALAYELQYVRPNVHLVDMSSGHFADVLLDSTDDDCVVIVDVSRYSSQTIALARRISASDTKLVVLSDTRCYWAEELTDTVILAPRQAEVFWTSMSSFFSMIFLLFDDVVRNLGHRAPERLERVSQLYREFVGYDRD